MQCKENVWNTVLLCCACTVRHTLLPTRLCTMWSKGPCVAVCVSVGWNSVAQLAAHGAVQETVRSCVHSTMRCHVHHLVQTCVLSTEYHT